MCIFAAGAGLGILQAAVGAAGAVMNFMAQNQAAKAQEAANKRAAQSAIVSANAQTQALHARELQEREAALQQKREVQSEARKAESRVVTSAGEAGITGLSLDSLLFDIGFTRGENERAIEANQDFTAEQLGRQAQGVRAQAAGRIASLPIVQRPSIFATGLQIAGQFTNAFSSYQTARA